jgi:hypothetical protein
METWTWRLGHGDLDTETWTWRLGHGDLDMETWTKRHGRGHGHGHEKTCAVIIYKEERIKLLRTGTTLQHHRNLKFGIWNFAEYRRIP